MSLLTVPFYMGGILALVKSSSSQSFEILHVNPEVWLSLVSFFHVFVIDIIQLWLKPIDYFLVSGKQGMIYA